MVEIDVDALSIDEEVPIPILRGMAESRGMAIIGNVSPTTTLLMGSASNVEKETRRCIDEGIDAVAPGGSLEMYTPMENIVMMTRTAKRYGAEHHRQTMR
jgi:uroporphyrinogen-III decarboxylase